MTSSCSQTSPPAADVPLEVSDETHAIQTDQSTKQSQSRSEHSEVNSLHEVVCTNDQAIQVCPVLVDTGTCPSPSRSAVAKAVTTDQAVQTTPRTADPVITSSLHSPQEHQHWEDNLSIPLSPVNVPLQPCANSTEVSDRSSESSPADSNNTADSFVPICHADDICLSTSTDVNCETSATSGGQPESAGQKNGATADQSQQPLNKGELLTPLSLLNCIPAIEIEEDREDPVSPPQGTLVPRKKEKRVSFVDENVVETAYDTGEDSNDRLVARFDHP